MYDLIIVGGGASGMLSGIFVSEKLRVMIIEKNDRLGKKLLSTGNGRCNYTNVNFSKEKFHGESPELIEKFLEGYNSKTILKIFEDLGIPPHIAENGRVYPNSLQASSMLDVLRFKLEEMGVEIRLSENVKSIKKNDKVFFVTTDKNSYSSKNVLVATGGMSVPSSGSDGSGYKFFRNFGHKKTSTYPSLVQLKSDFPYLKAIDGVKVETEISFLADGKRIIKENDDVLFTSYGISGSAVLSASREVIRKISEGKLVEASIKLLDTDEVSLSKRFNSLGKRTVEKAMIGLTHKKIILPVLKILGIEKDRLSSSLSKSEISKISEILSDFRIKIIGDKGFASSQATQGGLSLSDFDMNTMESLKISGLYACGEILDIDGDCGGYNLSWAWISAMKAAKAVLSKRGASNDAI